MKRIEKLKQKIKKQEQLLKSTQKVADLHYKQWCILGKLRNRLAELNKPVEWICPNCHCDYPNGKPEGAK
jgi:hypothetical protein